MAFSRNEGVSAVGLSVASNFSDVEGNDLDYAITSGSLPTGVSLNTSTGALSGTPTVPGVYSFSVTATETDGSPTNLSSLAQAYQFTVSEASNDAPVAAGGTVTLTAADEDSILVGVSVAGDFSDEEGNTLNYARTSGSLPAGTALNSATGDITGTPTVPGVYSFGITATETNGAGGNLSSAEQAYSWTINNVNDAPVVSVNNGLTLLELTTATITPAMLAATDEDTADTASVLAFTVTTAPSSGTLYLSGSPLSGSDTFTQDDIDNNRVTYTETSGGTNDSFVFTLKDDENAGPTGQTFSITISPNSPPVVTAGATLNYTENNGAQAIDNTITITDVENDDIVSASVSISANYQSGEDALGFTDQNGITGSFNPATGILSLSGTTTIANYQTALRSVTYTNASEDPSTSPRTVTFAVTDIVNPSNGATSTINVSKANDRPTSSNNTVSTGEDTSRSLVAGDFPFVDVDGADALVSVQITQLPGAGSLTRSGSPVVDDEVIAVADLNGNLVFTPGNNENGAPYTTLLFKVSDGILLSTTDYTLTINVGASNDSPDTVGGTIALATQTENTALSGVSVTSGFTDPENNDLDYALTSGSLPAGVSLDTVSGAVTGTPTVSGAFSFGITATETDGTGLSSPEQAFSLIVNGVNDAPVPVGGTVTLPNVDAGVAIAGIDVTSGFMDEESNTLSYALSAGSLPDGVTINANGDLQGTPTSWGLFSFSVIATETNGNPTNLSSSAQVFSLTVDADDNDADTVPDFIDNCPADANTDQADTDNDDEGDVCDTDDDDDGMPDTFESDNGFDPLDSVDATGDADGDGVINLDEYLQGTDPNVDTVPPQFSGVDDITIDAVGYFTYVDLSSVKALDNLDGKAAAPDIDSVTGTTSLSKARLSLFRPGQTVITWTASDSNGNVATVNQAINVRPLANLLPNQVAIEGGVVTIGVRLNGEAPTYPVTFDYTVSGTAGSADHDAVDGSLSIASGTDGELVVNLADDGVVEGSETLVITLSNPQNAALGNKTRHTVVINEGNMAPAVALTVAQATRSGPLVTADGGTVTVTAVVSDLNAGDTFTYDWSQSSSFLMAINGTGGSGSNTFEFDPTGLSAGVYPVIVSVTDSGSPAATKSTRLVLNLKASAPALTSVDSDGDGVNDDVEGYQDADGNGIADYLDPYNSASGANLIPNQTGQLQKTLLLQTDAGLKLRMGEAGLNADATGALVSRGNIETYVNQSGGSPNLTKDTYRNVGGIFDFEVHGLPVGESADVVIPLSAGILVDAVYRKFELQNGWRMFVYNTNNSIRSARSLNGVCPAPGHASYAVGLAEFNDCVQLTIQDGGPNDADGAADGVIRDPGGVAVADVTPEHVTPTPDDGSGGGGGGGTLHPLLLLWLAGWLLTVRGYRKRK